MNRCFIQVPFYLREMLKQAPMLSALSYKIAIVSGKTNNLSLKIWIGGQSFGRWKQY